MLEHADDETPKNKPEKITKPAEVVQIGKIFSPFTGLVGIDIWDHIKDPNSQYRCYFKHVILKVDGLPDLPISMGYHNDVSYYYNHEVLTPIHPDDGYGRLHVEDFDPQQRVSRNKEREEYLNEEFRTEGINRTDQWIVYIGANDMEYTASSIPPEEFLDENDEIKPEYYNKLKNLRLQLMFPSMSLESQISGNDGIDFENFYPLETGPLAEVKDKEYDSTIDYRKGFDLYIPHDPVELAKVKARFVLAKQQKITNYLP